MIDYLLSQEVQQYISDHLYDDPAELMLRSPLRSSEHFHLVLDQIRGRRKAKSKLPTWFATEGIIYPQKVSMEQCSSEETALYKAGLINGVSLVDLTGGFGVDTYYLSNSFKRVDYIERQEVLAERAAHNFKVLEAHHIQVNILESLDFLKSTEDSFSAIYVDPARRGDADQKVFRFEECEPDLTESIDQLKHKADQILVKASPMLEIKQGIEALKGVTQVHIVAVQNEVKEVLFLIDQQANYNPKIFCLNLKSDSAPFTFDYSVENEADVDYAKVLEYLYEPNAAIMKAGGFNSLAMAYPLQKLHSNTHLYTADLLIEDFPGKVFKVENRLSMNKKDIKKHFPEKKANITTRNFPMSVSQIRRKTGLNEGGDFFLYGLTDVESTKLLRCRRLV